VVTPRPFYNELLVRTPHDGASVQRRLVESRFLAGVPVWRRLSRICRMPLLLAFTEHTRAPRSIAWRRR